MNVKIISVLAHVEYTIPPICQLPNVKVFRCAGPGKRLKTTEPKGKKLTDYGYQAGKISMKEQAVIFHKIVEKPV